jgi:two-component system, OmpR family, KDP operon response regulator KdpE
MSAQILIVDDEPQMRRALRAGLRANGFEVSLAATGEEALDTIPLSRPDIVLLDLMLPGIDGLEVVRQLREWSSVPVIVVSARGEERAKVQALDLGADDYLTKPFGMDELLARIRVALRHAALANTSNDPLFEDGDLRIDLAARLVTIRGQEVHLTPTEYDLLRELASHAGKVMTHHQLLGRVWGPASVSDTQYLRTYVNQLRRKIEADPAHPQRIVNEPGIGYRYRRVEP